MMSEHTKEIWKRKGPYICVIAEVGTEDDNRFPPINVASFTRASDAERALCCVNAMAGIDDPVATMAEIRAAIAPIKHYVQMRHEKPLRSMGDDIHGIHANSEWEAVLKLSHLEVIAALLSRMEVKA